MHLQPFDPLHVNKSITVAKEGKGRVSLKFDFRESDVVGFKKFECIHAR